MCARSISRPPGQESSPDRNTTRRLGPVRRLTAPSKFQGSVLRWFVRCSFLSVYGVWRNFVVSRNFPMSRFTRPKTNSRLSTGRSTKMMKNANQQRWRQKRIRRSMTNFFALNHFMGRTLKSSEFVEVMKRKHNISRAFVDVDHDLENLPTGFHVLEHQ